ncbi:MAG TPA: alpha-ketoglutarate-dependent dioxygenase AlkB [Candidatus Polarisedimenticolaceae bacterium]|nr:alpha-ketoglutarate-dependent dioxygenase AlkB [Candidatus Polarisedimenticolaceae bacterium]
MSRSQADLFAGHPALPPGFRLHADLLAEDEEQGLLRQFAGLEFKPFDFRGFLGKRRTVSFGWRYDFSGGGLQKAEEIPGFLLPVRAQAAAAFGVAPESLEQVSVIEYPAGATIGWHRDRAVFGTVVGVSLRSACTFRFRRRTGDGWERRSLVLVPRSAYVMEGESRREWEHSIPPVPSVRYSITMRTMR